MIFGRSVFADTVAIPNEAVVKFKNGILSQSAILKLESKLNFKLKRWIPNTKFAVIEFNQVSKGKELTRVQNLMLAGEIDIAEPNWIYNISQIPNDPEYSKLWGLNNTGSNDPSSVGIAGVDISSEKAWDIQTGNKNLTVAVIDTGVAYNHHDLKDNIWVNIVEKEGQPGIDDDENGYIDDIYGYDFFNNDSDPIDDNGHGSHCSGIIGAKGNNGIGITGINWNTQIMAIKVFSNDGRGGPLDKILQAIRYATKMGAKIINNSWGGNFYSKILEQEIREAGEKGVLFIAAAGNEKSNNDSIPVYPASYKLPNMISVAAVDNKGERATFSNYGRKTVHVAAPGESIYSVYPKKTEPTEGYEYLSGTSMATPHVTGIAALLLSNEPNLTPEEVKNRLILTSKPMNTLNKISISRGMVDAYNVLTNILAPPNLDDPVNWKQTLETHISTDHPYVKGTTISWEVEVPGAKQVALYFEKFRAEESFDKVMLKNRKGEVVEEFTGALDKIWSDSVEGDYVMIVLKTDKTNQDYGFDITKVAYR